MSSVVESAGRINVLLQQVLNGMVLCVIALAIFAQGLFFMIALDGGVENSSARLVSIFEAVRLAIWPGLAFAFFKLLLNVIRSFRSRPARGWVIVYLAFTTSPLLFGLSLAYFVKGAEPRTDWSRASESEQFLRGRDWAREMRPIRDSECTGSAEFMRGCRHAIAQRREGQQQDGRVWAAAHRPVRPSECKGPPYFVLGCRRYFYEHLAAPKPAGQHKYEGMTTAECRVEVNANYEASEQLDLENGNLRSVNVTRHRSWLPELEDCENYDRHAQQAMKAAPQESPYERLTRLVAKLKAQETLTPEEQAAVEADVVEVSGGSESGYRRAYLLLHDEYTQRLRGEYKEDSGPDAHLSCEAFQEKISEMQRLENGRLAELQALKRADGLITNGARHDELQRQRLDALWDWKRYTDGARAANCAVSMD